MKAKPSRVVNNTQGFWGFSVFPGFQQGRPLRGSRSAAEGTQRAPGLSGLAGGGRARASASVRRSASASARAVAALARERRRECESERELAREGRTARVPRAEKGLDERVR